MSWYFGLVVDLNLGFMCGACSGEAQGRLYFDNDPEDLPENHATIFGVCSEGCALSIASAVQQLPDAASFEEVGEVIWALRA